MAGINYEQMPFCLLPSAEGPRRDTMNPWLRRLSRLRRTSKGRRLDDAAPLALRAGRPALGEQGTGGRSGGVVSDRPGNPAPHLLAISPARHAGEHWRSLLR